MPFAYSESAQVVRSALGAVLRGRREAQRRTLSEVAAEAGLSPAHLSEVERGRKDVSSEKLLRICRALEVTVAELYFELARELGSDAAQGGRLEPARDPRLELERAARILDPDSLRSVAQFSAYLAMANPPPKPKGRIGFDPRR